MTATSFNMSALAVVCFALLFPPALGAGAIDFEDWEDLDISSKVAAAGLQAGHLRTAAKPVERQQPDHLCLHSASAAQPHVGLLSLQPGDGGARAPLPNQLLDQGNPKCRCRLPEERTTAGSRQRHRCHSDSLQPGHSDDDQSLAHVLADRQMGNYRLEPSDEFKMLCFSAHNCRRLSSLMKHKPDLFSNLQMGFSVTSKTSRSTTATISAESIRTGRFFSRLNQRFPTADFCLLTAEDANQLVSDSVSNVAVQIFDDTGVVNPNSAVYIDVRDILIKSTVSSSLMDRALWNSVFWNDDNARPDKTSKIISDVYRKSESECQQLIRNSLRGDEEREHVATANVDSSRSSLADFSFSYEQGFRKTGLLNKQIEKEEFLKTLRRSRQHVEWDGESFQPKDLLLSRVNMAAVRNQATFTEVKSSVTYATVGLTMSVKTVRPLPPDRTMEHLKDLAEELNVQLGSTGPAGTPGANGRPGQAGIPGVPGRVIPSAEQLQVEKTLASLELGLATIVSGLTALNSTVATLDKSRDAVVKEKINCAVNNALCRDLFTRQGFEDGGISWLKEHNVLCRRNEYLSRFEFIQPRQSEMRYDYRCCRLTACQKCVD